MLRMEADVAAGDLTQQSGAGRVLEQGRQGDITRADYRQSVFVTEVIQY